MLSLAEMLVIAQVIWCTHARRSHGTVVQVVCVFVNFSSHIASALWLYRLGHAGIQGTAAMSFARRQQSRRWSMSRQLERPRMCLA